MTKTYLTIFLTVCVLVFAGCKSKPAQQGQSDKESAKSSDAIEAKTAPDFALKNYDGKEVKLSDYKGKVIVLEWFNYECPFCLYHYDHSTAMVDMAKKYMDSGVVWLAINSTSHQTTEKNKEFATVHKVPFPILDDRDGKVGHLYGATRTPNMFIIGKEGKIIYEGAIDNAPIGKVINQGEEVVNYVAKALDELMTGEQISISKTDPYGCTVKYAE